MDNSHNTLQPMLVVEGDSPIVSETKGASSSGHSSSVPVVWKRPSRAVPMAPAAVTDVTVHVKVCAATSPIMLDEVTLSHDGAMRSPLKVLRACSIASSHAPSPSVGDRSSSKRPSMHHRPIDVQDVLDAMQEEDAAEMVLAGRSGSCPYVVPGLYEEVCRQHKAATVDDEAEWEGGYVDDCDGENRDDESAADASYQDSRPMNVVLYQQEDEGEDREQGVPQEQEDVAAEAPHDEEAPPAENDDGDDGIAVDELEAVMWELQQQAVETLVLKELVARDALEAMAQAEVETALLVGLQMRAQQLITAQRDREVAAGVTAQTEPQSEVANDIQNDKSEALAQVTYEDDVSVHEPSKEEALAAEEEAVTAAPQDDAEVRPVTYTPHAPTTPKSGSSSTRSSPRTAATTTADAAAVAAPCEDEATEAAVAADHSTYAVLPRVAHKAETVPATSVQHTPAKRCSSAGAAATFDPATRPLLPSLQRGPGARIQPYNAFLESVNRTRQVRSRPSVAATTTSSRQSQAFFGNTTIAAPTLLPRIERAEGRHLIDQRRFYERGGQYDYTSLFKQQHKRETLMQLVVPLPGVEGCSSSN